MPNFAALQTRVNAACFKHINTGDLTFTPPVGASVQARAVFDAAMAHVDDMGVATYRPGIRMETGLVAGLAEGWTVLANATTYAVRQVLPLAEGGMQHVVLARV